MADPKILYWVSGIVIALLFGWVGWVNLKLENRPKLGAEQKPKPQAKKSAVIKKDEKKEEEADEEDDDDEEDDEEEKKEEKS